MLFLWDVNRITVVQGLLVIPKGHGLDLTFQDNHEEIFKLSEVS